MYCCRPPRPLLFSLARCHDCSTIENTQTTRDGSLRGDTMPGSTPAQAADRTAVRPAPGCFVFVLLAWCCAPTVALDIAHLELSDEAVSKVETAATAIEGNASRASGSAAVTEGGNPAIREQFETLLRRENVGTYSLYRKLPERSREEVFPDCRAGASTEALRKKVVNRYLNP